MLDSFISWLTASRYMPHGNCYLWQTPLVALHVASDLLIAIAYFSIPTMLICFVRRRQGMPFSNVFVMFGAFIIACGIGHLFDIWTLWFPTYWLSGIERAVTALVSCYTAVRLVELMPQFLALRSPEELAAVNAQLQTEVAARQRAQQTLQSVVQGTSAVTGREFFAALAENLAIALKVNCVLIGERLGTEPEQLQTLACWQDGQLAENTTYSVVGMPSERVLDSGEAEYISEQVQAQFPHDASLAANQAWCHLCVPLLDGEQAVLGVICLSHDQPLRDPDMAQAIVTLFATKAATELQRQRAESALRDARDELEQRVASRTTELHAANEQLQRKAVRERTTATAIQRMRQSLALEEIFRATTEEVRRALDCDRVVVYDFAPDWSGAIVAEAVAAGWRSLLAIQDEQAPWCEPSLQSDRCTVRLLADDETTVQDTYLRDTQGGQYCQGRDYLPVNDIYAAGFSDCYLELLASLEARAYLIVPIFQGDRLWGLLASYQNDGPRQWQPDDIQIATQVGNQLGVAIQQAELFQSVQQQATELQVAKDAADRASRAKSEFLAKISHELRTPLNAILGFTQLMQHDTSLSARNQRYVQTVNRSGEHLLGLINNILEMSKIEAGRQTLNCEPFDLHDLLDGLHAMLALEATAKGIELAVNRAATVPRHVAGDGGKLRQVLLNLLGNALKFTEVGQVSLTVTGESPQLHFAIADTGPGIAPEEQATLFDAFAQTSTGRRSGKGTGLGLSISQQYIRLLGGELAVESTVGQGTCFHFTIPVQTIQELPAIAERSEPRPVLSLASDQPTCRIAIAEDNPVNRELLRDLLVPLGFAVREAADGQDAIALWREWQPQAILLDLRMPLLDGYQVAREIRQYDTQVKILALTASALESDRRAVLAAGCNDFLSKPFATEELLQQLQQHLGLQYRYAEDASSDSAAIAPTLSSAAVQARLQAQPAAWRQALAAAAARCSDDSVLTVVQQLPAAEAALAAQLEQWLEQYEFDKILTALEAATATSEVAP